jgi:heat shock protein HslJ
VASPTPAASEAPSTLSLDGENIAGNSGCNGFGGSYTASDSTLSFGPIISTLIACESPDLQAQERAIFTALDGEVSYTIQGNTLRLFYDGGNQALTYEAQPAPRLEGVNWRLLAFGDTTNPTTASTERPATLSFDGERVGGTTGCNSIRGPYTVADGTISFGPLASTLALCTDEALQRQEDAILAALSGQVAYSLTADRLQISYGDNQTLTYEAEGGP